MKRLILLVALLGAVACGAKSPSSPETTPAVATQAISYMMLVGIPGDFAAGSVVATLDVPVSLLAASNGATPKGSVPVNGATLTLKNGTVLPLTGSLDLNTLKVALTSTNGLYRITVDLTKDKINPDGTFSTSDGKVGGIIISVTPAPAKPVFWCGFFDGDEKGWINVQTNIDGLGNGPLQGSFDDGSGESFFKGESKANKVTFSLSIPGGSASGSGDILGGVNMSGFWNNTEGQKGQWSVSSFGCS